MPPEIRFRTNRSAAKILYQKEKKEKGNDNLQQNLRRFAPSENDCFAVYMVIETVATRKVQMKNKQANEQKASKHILIVILVILF